MTATETGPRLGSWLAPSFDNARVMDAMRSGVITCQPETPMVQVAQMMATHHVHSIIVTRIGEEGSWGILSAIDLLRVARRIDEHTAGEIATHDVATVYGSDALKHAVDLMLEHRVTHLVVIDRETEQPIGVLSTLDLAGVLAWGRA